MINNKFNDVVPIFYYFCLIDLCNRKGELHRFPVRGRCADGISSIERYADFVLTEDSDLLAYGCKKVSLR